MKKMLIVLLLLPALVEAQSANNTFTVMGKFTNFSQTPQWVFIQYRANDSWKKDSIKPVGNSYTFTGTTEEPLNAYFWVKYADAAPGKRPPMATVYLMPGTISINSMDSFTNIKVTGSVAHAEYEKLEEQLKPYDDEMNKFYTQYSEARKNKDDATMHAVETKIDSLDALIKENVYGKYIKENPSSVLCGYAIQEYAGYDIDAAKVEPLYNLLDEKTKAYPSVKSFKEMLDLAKKTAIGNYAMDFTQNDTLDKPVSLSSFKGKYVLVDFWASWCGPCRAENPNVVKVFNEYKDKGFHILGVSLDREGQKERWLKAIHDDKLTWTQVSDLKFWDNEVAKQYGIRAIPQNILVDPGGKIIAKNLRGEDLEKKLQEVMQGTK